MKIKTSKLIFPILLLMLATSILTSLTSAKIVDENDGLATSFMPAQNCYSPGVVFVGKKTTGADCFCDMTFSHFVVICDTRYYDDCRLVMCSGDPCCRTEFPE